MAKREDRIQAEKVIEDLKIKLKGFTQGEVKFIAISEKLDLILDCTEDWMKVGEALIRASEVLFQYEDLIEDIKERHED